MKVLCYDTESTGLEKPFEVPFQFGAKVFDDAGNLLSSVNLRGRIPRHVLPSPAALIVTGQKISSLVNSSTSAYEFSKRIYTHFEENSPAIVTGYNTISYDEEILRHTFYGNLLLPYITQFNGNERLDILLALKASYICDPALYDLPSNKKGKRSFKLEHIAPALGFFGHDAHDALGDVDATMHVAKTLRTRSPRVWQAVRRMRSKTEVQRILSSARPIIKVEWNHIGDKPSMKVLLPICQDLLNGGKWLCINLDSDVRQLLSLDAAGLVKAFRSSGGPASVVCVATNKMPLIFAWDDEAVSSLNLDYDLSKVDALQDDKSFAGKLRDAYKSITEGYLESPHVQEQLYSGGFFPSAEDSKLLSVFHNGSAEQKYEVLGSFRDERARKLGRLLIGSEWPSVMSVGDRAAYEDELNMRLSSVDAPWMTVPKALAEIRQLREKSPLGAEILAEYEEYLLVLSRKGLTAAAELAATP